MMYTLGHEFVPPRHSCGGLRYHGDSPWSAQLVIMSGLSRRWRTPERRFEAALQFARTEGIVPAPESAHAVRAAIDEALEREKPAKSESSCSACSGHGHFDLAA